jgi:hypothetical protein
MRGTAQLNSLQVGRVLSRSIKVIKVIPTKVAPFGNGTIKSNQRSEIIERRRQEQENK